MAFGIDDAIAGVTGLINRVIDRAIPDPAQAAAAKMAILSEENQQTIREKTADLTAILAEANSTDKWTSRARPSFLYVMYAMILWSIPMGIISAWNPLVATHIAEGMQAFLTAIPEGLWTLFTSVALGYVVARSSEKSGGIMPLITGKKK